MAEAVVVRLKAVEVEQGEDPGVGFGLVNLREVFHQLTTVGKTGEGIGAGFGSTAYTQAAIPEVH